jgi:hypothetical protein
MTNIRGNDHNTENVGVFWLIFDALRKVLIGRQVKSESDRNQERNGKEQISVRLGSL